VRQETEPIVTTKVRPWPGAKGSTTTTAWEVDIRFTFPDGTPYRQRVKSPVTSKSGSLSWGRERERHLLAKPTNEAKVTKAPTLAEFTPVYLADAKARRLSGATLTRLESTCRLHLLPLLGDRPMDRLREADFAALRAALSDFKPRTVNLATSQLATMALQAWRWGLTSDPPPKVKKLRAVEKPIVWFQPRQVEGLIKVAQGVSPVAELVILLGCDAGLRRGEMLALEWGDVDFNAGQITIARSDWQGSVGPTKSGLLRKVPTTSRLLSALRAHQVVSDSPRVVCAAGGRWWTADRVAKTVKGITNLAGYGAHGPHTLRHTFCSTLASRGVPARSIQALAGHSSIRTTERYLHLAPDALTLAINALEPGGEMLEGASRGKEKPKRSK